MADFLPMPGPADLAAGQSGGFEQAIVIVKALQIDEAQRIGTGP